jgi:hypothetical protein
LAGATVLGEVAYFSDLSRDGAGDFDGDGQADLNEFLSGTDPSNTGSVLRLLTLSSLGAGAKKILWSAVPGKTYRVQFKHSATEASWTALPGVFTASSTTAGAEDNAAGEASQRFYRVVLVP